MDTIQWSDFEKIDVRTGTILEARVFEKARKPAYQLLIDFGPLGIKKSSAQITERYALHELTGRQIIAVVNFPPKQIGNFMSECLVLGAVEEDHRVTLLTGTHPVANGTKIA
jgi:tRNA-binding protein